LNRQVNTSQRIFGRADGQNPWSVGNRSAPSWPSRHRMQRHIMHGVCQLGFEARREACIGWTGSIQTTNQQWNGLAECIRQHPKTNLSFPIQHPFFHKVKSFAASLNYRLDAEQSCQTYTARQPVERSLKKNNHCESIRTVKACNRLENFKSGMEKARESPVSTGLIRGIS
jgi:hypothetical protein